MRRADLVVGVGLLAFAGFYFQQSFSILRGFASDRLGPAFFPRLLALVLAAMALALIVRALSGRSDRSPLPAVRMTLLYWTLGLLAAYALLMPKVGFLVATPLLLGAVIWLLGLRQWATLAASAVGLTLVLYAVFGRALHVLLPMGPFK